MKYIVIFIVKRDEVECMYFRDAKKEKKRKEGVLNLKHE